MLTSQAHCQIIAVSAIKEQNGFKKCFATVRTKELRDEMTNEVIRQSGTFEAEVAIKDDKVYRSLLDVALPVPSDGGAPGEAAFVPCHFMLRSFTYKEKDQEKLGKQLQLKRWWR